MKMACNTRKNSNSLPGPSFQVCIIGDGLRENKSLLKAIDTFNLPTVYSKNGLEFMNHGAEFTTIYILEEFEGEVYTSLLKAGQRILGPTTVMQYAERDEDIGAMESSLELACFLLIDEDIEIAEYPMEVWNVTYCIKKCNEGSIALSDEHNDEEPLPNNIRPLYTLSMKNMIISLSGFRVKEEVSGMVSLIHHMGGSVRRDFKTEQTTHLIATPNATSGEKYKYAAAWGIPIMTCQWVYEVWARRYDIKCNAADKEFMQYRLLPFVGCKMAFIGYQSDEEEHMIEVSAKNGGEIVQPSDPACTHIVVEDGHTFDSSEYRRNIYIVKKEWFWACIQMEAKAEEKLYAFENPNITSSSLIMPVRGNKRKRLESVAHMLAMESVPHDEFYSAKPEHAKLSISGSFLDATLSPEKSLDLSSELLNNDLALIKSPPLDMRTLSPRQQVCYELFQTESNYVGILNTIMTIFKEPLENPERGDPLLAPAEIKIIFGNLPPIFEIHQEIRNELALIIHSWSDDHSIGKLILDHAQGFMKAYPPFVNFFEKTKEVLANCDATKPRFHAFLKRCQSKPECGRQSLQELLIRPVQRLPSVILLLSDVLKHTPKSNADHTALERAIQSLKDVMMHINEDKRKTEGQVAMFDLVNDIENCPPNLLSSHRSLISKTDMFEVTEMLNKKGCTISMFLFTDVLEICKKRGKPSNHSMKSPGVTSLSGTLKHQTKSYKHLDLIHLSHVKRVVDIQETDDCKNCFALVTWSSKEVKELLYAFVLLDDVCKSTFLRTLCRQVANTVCKADAENLLTSLHPDDLSLQSNDSSGNILSKAFNKTRNTLGRALSMRRTPTRRGLSRAVSTIISPLRTFGTPSNNMQTLRLSSVTNLSIPYLLPEAMLPLSGQRFKAFRSRAEYQSKTRSLNRPVIVSRLHQSETKS